MLQLLPHIVSRGTPAGPVYRVNVPGDITGSKIREALQLLNRPDLVVGIGTQIQPEQFSFISTENAVIAMELLKLLSSRKS